MLSYRQIFAAVTIEQRFEGMHSQAAEQIDEPLPLDPDLLSSVSGGKTNAELPGGGW